MQGRQGGLGGLGGLALLALSLSPLTLGLFPLVIGEDMQPWVNRELDTLKGRLQQLEQENMFLKTKSLKTCEELKWNNVNTSGTYYLDPDSTGSPSQFYCDFEKGYTEVGHDHEDTTEIGYCEGEGCFSLALTYSVPMQQIQALIASSETCEQEIKFECKLAPLKNKAFGIQYGWWTDREGDKKYYFDGDDEDNWICDSSTNAGVCRCDVSLVPLWNHDTGKITQKGSLPISTFNYGGFFHVQQAAKITIGRLRCSGKAAASSELISTCSSLKKNGQTSNGFYLTKDSPDERLAVNYCRLSNTGYKEEEIRIGEPQKLSRTTEEMKLLSFTNGHSSSWRRAMELKMSLNESRYFTITDDGLVAKESGLYVIFPTALYNVRMYVNENHNDLIVKRGNTFWLEKDDNINFNVQNRHEPQMTIKITKL